MASKSAAESKQSGKRHFFEVSAEEKAECNKKYVLLCAQGQEPLARSLHSMHPTIFEYFETKWDRFPDNTDNIKVGGFSPTNRIAGANVVFLASFHSNDVSLSQFHVITMLGESFVQSLCIVLPFFPTGTMERVMEEGVCATANTMAKMFSNLPSGSQKNRLMVYDLHTLQNRFYFSHNTLATTHTAFPLIVERVHQLNITNPTATIAIAFPDEGAEKRFGKFFTDAVPNIDVILCGKHRDPNDPSKRFVSVLDGTACGKIVLIIDDIVQSGGTLAECAKILHSQGAVSVSAFCTHSVFPQQSWKRFAKGGDREKLFQKFYVTNSNPAVSSTLPRDDIFDVLDIAPLVARDLFSVQ